MRWLPVLLSVIAGSTDVVSLLGLGLFSAHVTGNLIILIARLVAGRADNTCLFLSVPIFVLVLGLTGLLFAALQARRINPLRPLLLLQLLMLGSSLVVWMVSGHASGAEAPGVIIAGQLCVAAMAVQNALVALSLHGSPTTAVMTTNLTRLTMDVIETLVGRNPAEVATALHRAKHTWPVVVGFVVGAGLGAGCFRAAGLYALGLPTSLALGGTAVGTGINSAPGFAEAAAAEKSREMTVELNYGWTVRPGMLVQPSLQYIVNPGGDKSISNALALGINVVFKF
jgi:Predicted membrane protein